MQAGKLHTTAFTAGNATDVIELTGQASDFTAYNPEGKAVKDLRAIILPKGARLSRVFWRKASTRSCCATDTTGRSPGDSSCTEVHAPASVIRDRHRSPNHRPQKPSSGDIQEHGIRELYHSQERGEEHVSVDAALRFVSPKTRRLESRLTLVKDVHAPECAPVCI